MNRETLKRIIFDQHQVIKDVMIIDRNIVLLDNIVALHLYRTHKNCLYYFKGNKADIDFHLSELNIAIQVAYSIDEKDAYDREVNNLITFAKANQSKSNLIIVTYEEERIIEIDGFLIKVIPLKKFLLN